MTNASHTTNETFTTEQLIDMVFDHAVTYYNNGRGWDIVVETMTKDEVRAIIGKTRTRFGACQKVYRYIAPAAAYRKEIEATAF